MTACERAANVAVSRKSQNTAHVLSRILYNSAHAFSKKFPTHSQNTA